MFIKLDKNNMFVAVVKVEIDAYGLEVQPPRTIKAAPPTDTPAKWDWEKKEWRYPSKQPCCWDTEKQEWVYEKRRV